LKTLTWQEARLHVRKIREAAKDLHFSSRVQAAAISSMAGIAEGFTRRPD
jgi:hypothetical protein